MVVDHAAGSPETPKEGGNGSAPDAAAAPERNGSDRSSTRVPGQEIERLAVGEIVPSRFQPRRVFDQPALERLAASIRSSGLVQPIVVRRVEAGGYELVAGERRWRAAQIAGLTSIPAIVADLSDEQAAQWALVENLQREDLNPMERARALRSLVELFSLTQGEAARRVGLERPTVTNLIRLTELEEPIQAMLETGALTMGHGRALLALGGGPRRVKLAKLAAEQSWPVRRLEEYALGDGAGASGEAGGMGGTPAKRAPSWQADLEALEKQLGEHLGSRVRIRTKAGGRSGTIQISYFDLDHFDALMTRLTFKLKS